MTLSILALRTRDNKLEDVAIELIGKAKRFYPNEVNVILPVGISDTADLIKEIEQAGADKIYLVKNDKLENYSTNFYRAAVFGAVSKIQPDILLIGATTNGRDLAPRIASHLQVGLTADCTELSINEEGKLAATRPTFGGSLMATILSRKVPQMATVRPKVFQKTENIYGNKAAVETIEVDLTEISTKIKEINFVPKTQDLESIEDAQIIVAAGKAIKTQEEFQQIEELASLLGGKAAASRGLVDKGICKPDIQIGQTGKTVAPKIYIACGISGAIQHIEGMKGAQTIIAINKDPNAPIFKIADYKIVGDLQKILTALIEQARNL